MTFIKIFLSCSFFLNFINILNFLRSFLSLWPHQVTLGSGKEMPKKFQLHLQCGSSPSLTSAHLLTIQSLSHSHSLQSPPTKSRETLKVTSRTGTCHHRRPSVELLLKASSNNSSKAKTRWQCQCRRSSNFQWTPKLSSELHHQRHQPQLPRRRQLRRRLHLSQLHLKFLSSQAALESLKVLVISASFSSPISPEILADFHSSTTSHRPTASSSTTSSTRIHFPAEFSAVNPPTSSTPLIPSLTSSSRPPSLQWRTRTTSSLFHACVQSLSLYRRRWSKSEATKFHCFSPPPSRNLKQRRRTLRRLYD